MANSTIFPNLLYRFNRETDLKCTIRFQKGLSIWAKENTMYQNAAFMLGIKPYEVIFKKGKVVNDKAQFIVDKNLKYKVEVGAKVLVIKSSSEQIETTIKELDTEFKLIKVAEYKELPFAFQNVRFLEAVKIKEDGK